jgi:hypothetical protein
MTKIATLNLALELTNKKTLIKQIILQENIDVMRLQETEVGLYISSTLNYVKRNDLERTEPHLAITEMKESKKY